MNVWAISDDEGIIRGESQLLLSELMLQKIEMDIWQYDGQDNWPKKS